MSHIIRFICPECPEGFRQHDAPLASITMTLADAPGMVGVVKRCPVGHVTTSRLAFDDPVIVQLLSVDVPTPDAGQETARDLAEIDLLVADFADWLDSPAFDGARLSI